MNVVDQPFGVVLLIGVRPSTVPHFNQFTKHLPNSNQRSTQSYHGSRKMTVKAGLRLHRTPHNHRLGPNLCRRKSKQRAHLRPQNWQRPPTLYLLHTRLQLP